MLLSIALMVLCGLGLGGLLKKLGLPALLGMMVAGIALGPHMLNWLDPAVLAISAELRQMALIVILLRAGLALDLDDLKKVGRPALLMCFVPATVEMVAVVLFAPPLLGITPLEATVLGAVLAAVSPAVVVPRMLKLMEEGYGQQRRIPQLIMTGASVDDVYVIVLFTAFMGMVQGQGFDVLSLVKVPVSIVLGIAAGVAAGVGMAWLFARMHLRDTVKILLLLAVSFLLVSLEEAAKAYVPVSGLLAVMAMGAAVRRQSPVLAGRVAGKYAKIWVIAELFLFVLVGAAVDIGTIGQTGFAAVLLVLSALVFRMAGVFLCQVKTALTPKEKLFAAIAYLPKATVQAAIGGIPLSLGLPAGGIILSVAVVAIMVTAPLGAIGVDVSYTRLLEKGEGSGG